jgi:hypothetical protein
MVRKRELLPCAAWLGRRNVLGDHASLAQRMLRCRWKELAGSLVGLLSIRPKLLTQFRENRRSGNELLCLFPYCLSSLPDQLHHMTIGIANQDAVSRF